MEEVVCYLCGHKQKTKSKMLMITCSSCQRKFYKAGNPNPKMSDDLQTNINKEELAATENKRVKLD